MSYVLRPETKVLANPVPGSLTAAFVYILPPVCVLSVLSPQRGTDPPQFPKLITTLSLTHSKSHGPVNPTDIGKCSGAGSGLQ